MAKKTDTRKPMTVQAVVPTGFPDFGAPVTVQFTGKPRQETVLITPFAMSDGDIKRLAEAARKLPDEDLAVLLLEKLFREATLVPEGGPTAAKSCACKGRCKKSAGTCAAH
jgi:hypothetical protein